MVSLASDAEPQEEYTKVSVLSESRLTKLLQKIPKCLLVPSSQLWRFAIFSF